MQDIQKFLNADLKDSPLNSACVVENLCSYVL